MRAGLNDEQLVSLARGGDDEAREVLIKKSVGIIKSILEEKRLYINGGDKDDLIQEGMISINRAIDTFDGRSKFSTYVYACIKNGILTAIRNSERKKNDPLNKGVSLSSEKFCGDEIADSSFDPEEAAIKSEIESEQKKIIREKLSEYEYGIYELMDMGYSASQICGVMKKDRKSIDNALQRIRKKLR